jgi:hypothetical protein
MKLPFVTVLAIAFLPNYALAALTSKSAPEWTQPSSQMIADLPSPPNPGTPDNQRTPGGTRTDLTSPKVPEACQQKAKPLTALVPIKGSESLTTAEYPILWFYIPDAPEDIQSIEFSLHDWKETTTLYRTSPQLTKTPGVIGIPLPPIPEHSLKLNEPYYKWYLVIKCTQKATLKVDDLKVMGSVKRVEQSLNPESPSKVIWYDLLTNLAKRYLSNPQNTDIKKDWTELLKSVGLEGLAQEPLIQPTTNPKK